MIDHWIDWVRNFCVENNDCKLLVVFYSQYKNLPLLFPVHEPPIIIPSTWASH